MPLSPEAAAQVDALVQRVDAIHTPYFAWMGHRGHVEAALPARYSAPDFIDPELPGGPSVTHLGDGRYEIVGRVEVLDSVSASVVALLYRCRVRWLGPSDGRAEKDRWSVESLTFE